MDDKIAQLQKQIDELKVRRVSQSQIIPGQVKQAAMGEPNAYVNGGTTANKPTIGNAVTFGASIYFDNGTNKLYCWNSVTSTWVSVTLS